MRKYLTIDMHGMLNAVVETPDGAGKVILNGNLNFYQDEAILIDNVKRSIWNDDPIKKAYSYDNDQLDYLSLNEIIELY